MSESAPVLPGNAGRADYPRMLYHADGQMRIVATPEEHQKLHEQGWATEPSAVHRRPTVSHSPIMNGADPTALLFRSVIEDVLNERGLTRETVAQLLGHGSSLRDHGSSDDKPVGHFKTRR